MLTDEMKEAIEKNLPAQIGGVLQERLGAVDDLERELADARDSALKLGEQVQENRKREDAIARRENEAAIASDRVDTRESEVAEREKTATEAEHRVELATLRADLVQEARSELRSVLTEVFHSPMYRKTVTVSGSNDAINPDGGYVNTTPIHHNETTTTEVDES